jgi:beta-xylosidase
LASKNWYVWDVAPIYSDDGKVHVFCGRWPRRTKMGGWTRAAEIAHAVADDPRGPYRVLGTVFRGVAGEWDASLYNPTVHKVDNRYVMFYSGQANRVQQIGMATAPSLAGPWTKSPRNPIITCSKRPGHWSCAHASNPAFVRHPDGRYLLYYKGMTELKGLRTIGLAIADKLEGPYRDYPENPLITYTKIGKDIEDPYAFHYRGRFHLIVENRMNVTPPGAKALADAGVGGLHPGLIYESEDGLSWSDPKYAYMPSEHYFPGQRERFERPQILWKNGKPEYLFLAMKGGPFNTSTGACVKITDW